MLRERFADRPYFSLIEGDALAGKHELNPQILEAFNPLVPPGKVSSWWPICPYNIASPLIIELLIAGVDLLAFTVQKEVADRLRAGAGSDDYGPLSIMAQLLARVEMLRTLPPQAFWPARTIESALVRLTRDDRLGAKTRPFSQFIHSIFSYRRKTLRKALSQAGLDAEKLLQASRLDAQIRAEELTPLQLLNLFNQL